MKLGLGALSTLLVLAPAAAAAPAAISPAEREAVELALAYLAEGPGAWWDRLAADAPWREVGREAASAEIELRAGPREGVSWKLQTVVGEGREGTAVFLLQYPSGVDEGLVLELVPAGAGWRLHTVRSWAEPDPGAPTTEDPGGGGGGAAAAVAAEPGGRWWWLLLLALGAGLLAAAPVLAARRRRGAPAAFVAGTALVAGGLLVFSRLSSPPTPAVPPPVPVEEDAGVEGRLAELAELRRLLTSEAGAAGVEERFAAAPESGPAGRVARLWRAQYRLQAGDLAAADELLATFATPSRHPLADVLRARLAFLHAEGPETGVSYDHALLRLPDFDGLSLEAAEALVLLGLETRARSKLERLAESGTRLAEVHYWLARFTAVDHQTEAALEHFRTALRLDPLERRELLGDRIYAHLVRQGELFGLLRLISPEEPVLLADDLGSQPLAIPAGFEATYTGRTLRLARGSAELSVPGGAPLAPRDARSEDSESRRRRIEDAVLTEVPALIRAARTPGSISQPALRHRVMTAALALARRNRWSELLAITEGIAAEPERLPNPLVRVRVEALRRNRRGSEATRLLIAIAKGRAAESRKDPDTLAHLATFLLEAGEYDLAARVAQTAEAQSPNLPLYSMVPRIRMEERLAREFFLHRSEHFEVRYPARTSPYYVERLARVLERERRRLARWVPGAGKRPVEVVLFPFQDYFRVYDPGRGTLGLYDGRVRVPFAELPSLHPLIVSTFTHEVTHALVAAVTDDQAPHWFQEGLAQHVEMVENRINPVPDLFRRGSYLSFPLLEPVLANYPQAELVEIGYDEAMWLLHYVESRHGLRAIHRLLDSFAAGRTTEEALSEALGLTPSGLDAAFRRWALNDAPRTWNPPIIRYDLES